MFLVPLTRSKNRYWKRSLCCFSPPRCAVLPQPIHRATLPLPPPSPILFLVSFFICSWPVAFRLKKNMKYSERSSYLERTRGPRNPSLSALRTSTSATISQGKTRHCSVGTAFSVCSNETPGRSVPRSDGRPSLVKKWLRSMWWFASRAACSTWSWKVQHVFLVVVDVVDSTVRCRGWPRGRAGWVGAWG